MQLYTLRAEIPVIVPGIELPLENPAHERRRRPELSPFIHLGGAKGQGEYMRVPVSPALIGKRGSRMIYDAELRRPKYTATGLTGPEAHGYELLPSENENDHRLLVLIDTRGSRHQPSCIAGWKVLVGRAENLLVVHHLPGVPGRDGMCHIGFVRMHPGSELMVRAEGGKPFLLVYPSVEAGLLCDLEGLQMRNQLNGHPRHLRRDERRAERLRVKTAKRAEYRKKNEEARRKKLEAEKRQQSMERMAARSQFKKMMRYAQKLRAVRDPKERRELIARRLKLLSTLRKKQVCS